MGDEEQHRAKMMAMILKNFQMSLEVSTVVEVDESRVQGPKQIARREAATESINYSISMMTTRRHPLLKLWAVAKGPSCDSVLTWSMSLTSTPLQEQVQEMKLVVVSGADTL